MKFNGVCKSVDKIVVSDPSYKEDVWCRYERNGIGGKDWKVQGFIKDYSEPFEDITVTGKEFTICLSAPQEYVDLHEDGSFAHYSRNEVKEFDIGMDTACVGFGVNKHADEIKASREEWQPSCCLKTLTDGMFGNVVECSFKNEVKIIVISGSLDEDTGYSQKDILDYLVSSLDIELDRSLTVDEVVADASDREGRSAESEQKADKEDIDLS